MRLFLRNPIGIAIQGKPLLACVRRDTLGIVSPRTRGRDYSTMFVTEKENITNAITLDVLLHPVHCREHALIAPLQLE